MYKDQVGINAGIVWNTISTEGELTLSQLKRKTKIKEPLLSMAIGWLLREGNIKLISRDEVEFIALA